MAPSEEGWITEPHVINLLLQMKAVQVGDFLLVVGLGCHNIPPGTYEAVLEGFANHGSEAVWPDSRPAIGTVRLTIPSARRPPQPGQEDRWYICRENIVGWKSRLLEDE